MASTKKNVGEQVKEWVTFAIAVIAAVGGIIFWVQNASNVKIEHIEREVVILKADLNAIHVQNGEILRAIGKLEGVIESKIK
jgi:cytochrome b subunit of formate dehydrogenase